MATDGIVPPASASGGGSAAHPSVDELADLHAGALDDERARQIMPHVRRCAECTAVLDALSAVQAELRALPLPPMPASVAARLDAALAAERGEGSAPVPPPDRPSGDAGDGDSSATTQLPTQAEPSGGGHVVDLDRERMRRRRRNRLIGVAAAGLVLVGGGVIVGSQLTETDSGQIQAEPSTISQSAGESAENSDGQESNGPPEANRYDENSLQSGIGDVLQQGQLDHEDQSSNPDVAGDMAVPANRLRCLQALPDRPAGATLAVQFVEYEGEPAYVFVFAIPLNDDEVRVIVVPEECGTEPVDPLASFVAPR